jgi:hypothetical protein
VFAALAARNINAELEMQWAARLKAQGVRATMMF